MKINLTTPERCKRNLAILSVGMLCNMSSYRTLEALQSTLNKGIGVSSLAVIYTSSLISALFLPPYVIAKLKCRLCLILGPMGYALYTAANFYPTHYTLLPAGALLGMSTGVLWSSVTVYIIDLAKARTKLTQQDTTSIMAHYIGLFFGCVNLSLVVGMIFLAILFGVTVENGQMATQGMWLNATGYNVTTNSTTNNLPTYNQDTISLCGLYYEDNSSASKPTVSISQPVLYCMYVVFLVLNILASVLFVFLDDVEGENEPHNKDVGLDGIPIDNKIVSKLHTDDSPNSILLYKSTGTKQQRSEIPLPNVTDKLDPSPSTTLSNLKAVLRLIKKDKMVLLLTLITLHLGMIQAFTRGVYNSAWVSCAKGIQYTVYVMICYGAILSFSSVLSGLLLRCMDHTKEFAFATIVGGASMVALLVWKPQPGDTFVYFLLAATIAFCDGTYKSQLPCVYNVIFPNDKSSAATIQVMWNTGGSAILYLVGVTTYPIVSLLTVLCSLVIGFFMYVVAFRLSDMKDRSWCCGSN